MLKRTRLASAKWLAVSAALAIAGTAQIAVPVAFAGDPHFPQVLPSEPEDVDVDSEGELKESVEVEAEGPSTPETEDVIDWLLTPPVDPLVPKDAQILPLDFAFTVFGGSVYTVSFNIPAGMTPVALKGELQSTDDSELRVSTQARRVGAVSTLTTEFSFALEPEDVDSGSWC